MNLNHVQNTSRNRERSVARKQYFLGLEGEWDLEARQLSSSRRLLGEKTKICFFFLMGAIAIRISAQDEEAFCNWQRL